MKRKWEYMVTSLAPTGGDSPVPGSGDYEFWLNSFDEKGWELVSPVYRHWHGRDIPQQFYVFRRPFKSGK